jgi:hypothetical protein
VGGVNAAVVELGAAADRAHDVMVGCALVIALAATARQPAPTAAVARFAAARAEYEDLYARWMAAQGVMDDTSPAA